MLFLPNMLKVIFSSCIALAIVSCSSLKSIDNSDKKLGESYGPVKVDTANAQEFSSMLETIKWIDEPTEFTFSAPINQVCLKAGCWVKIDKGNGETLMVRFKDHFTIPVDTEIGTEAYFHGMAYWDEVSVEMLKHYAEDAGKSPEEIAKIIDPEYVMSFEADGIVLVK